MHNFCHPLDFYENYIIVVMAWISMTGLGNYPLCILCIPTVVLSNNGTFIPNVSNIHPIAQC